MPPLAFFTSSHSHWRLLCCFDQCCSVRSRMICHSVDSFFFRASAACHTRFECCEGYEFAFRVPVRSTLRFFPLVSWLSRRSCLCVDYQQAFYCERWESSRALLSPLSLPLLPALCHTDFCSSEFAMSNTRAEVDASVVRYFSV